VNRVLALVEGQTEEAFVGRLLQPHLWRFGVHITPTVLVTKRVTAGPDLKGGLSKWTKVLSDLRALLGDTAAVAVTTMLDYYGLPANVPGMGDRPSGTAVDCVLHVEAAIDAALNNQKLHSFLLLHEFEAVLYADPNACGTYVGSERLTEAMQQAVEACGTPEQVNETPQGAPSKRITAAYPMYQKTLHGPAIAEGIGLARIRSECPHFDEWLRWLESLG
jgi:hypothetical protein